MSGPLATLNLDPTAMVKVENVPVSPGAEYSLATLNGPGYVKSLWMAVCGGNNPTLDARIRVYYDGSATPTIDVDLGTLLAIHWGATGHELDTDHVHCEFDPSSYSLAFLINFPMPFGTSIKITYYYPDLSTETAHIFSQVAYCLTGADEANGQRLRAQNNLYQGGIITRQITDTNTILNTSGGAGSIVYCGYVGGVDAATLSPSSPNNNSWMERNFQFYIDGASSPTMETTGTEDTFDSGWYFGSAENESLGRASMVGVKYPSAQPHVVGMATDWWKKWGGVPYTQSAKIIIATEPAVVTEDRFVACVLYYQ